MVGLCTTRSSVHANIPLLVMPATLVGRGSFHSRLYRESVTFRCAAFGPSWCGTGLYAATHSTKRNARNSLN
jgi:hypothetical protein